MMTHLYLLVLAATGKCPAAAAVAAAGPSLQPLPRQQHQGHQLETPQKAVRAGHWRGPQLRHWLVC